MQRRLLRPNERVQFGSPLCSRLRFLFVADGATGGRLYSRAGNATGVPVGLTRTRAKLGPGFEFDGSTGRIDVNTMQLSGQITVLARLYAPAEHDGVVFEGSDASSTGTAALYDGADRFAGIGLRNPGSTLFANTAGLDTVAVDATLGYRLRPQDGTPNVAVFKDGKVIATGSQAGSYNLLASVSPRIGWGYNSGVDGLFKYTGRVGWMAAFRGALSDFAVRAWMSEDWRFLVEDDGWPEPGRVVFRLGTTTGAVPAPGVNTPFVFETTTPLAAFLAGDLVGVPAGDTDASGNPILRYESTTTPVAAGVTDIPEVVAYATVTAAAASSETRESLDPEQVTGVRAEARIAVAGQRSLIATRIYRR